VHVPGAEVVVHDVEDHGDAPPMALLDQRLQRIGAAVGRLDSEDLGRVIAPGTSAGEFGHRHDLDGIDPEILEMPQLFSRRLEGPGPIVARVRVVEGADVQLVNDQLIAGADPEVVPLPVESRIVDDPVAGGIGDLAGVGVDPGQLPGRRRQEIAVLVPRAGLGDLGVPAAVVLRLHHVPAAVPVVERADHGDLPGMWGPDPERRPVPMWDRPHPAHLRCRQRHRNDTIPHPKSRIPRRFAHIGAARQVCKSRAEIGVLASRLLLKIGCTPWWWEGPGGRIGTTQVVGDCPRAWRPAPGAGE
jgi:hypothetical protein